MAAVESLTSLGHSLSLSDSDFGWCVSSTDILEDGEALRHRLERDGYLYLPGCLSQDDVHVAREFLLHQLNQLGLVDSESAVSSGLAAIPWRCESCHHLAAENSALQSLLYSGAMIDLYRKLFGSDVRHFDFTWLRVIGPGYGTAPHCDSVYMGRGTSRLLTSWTPLMEITPDIGGLTVMPGSHRLETLNDYRASDVDTVCSNRPPSPPLDVHQWVGPARDGKLTEDPVRLQQELGLPWVTSPCYQPGDVVIFSIATVHGSLDNTSRRIRLSSDSRYQPADEAADERWVGTSPIGHGKQARKDIIC